MKKQSVRANMKYTPLHKKGIKQNHNKPMETTSQYKNIEEKGLLCTISLLT